MQTESVRIVWRIDGRGKARGESYFFVDAARVFDCWVLEQSVC